MATVNFSVPEEIKREFQETFRGENKSAVIARLMHEAVEARRRQERRAAALDALLDLRRRQAPVSDREIAKARKLGQIVFLPHWSPPPSADGAQEGP